MTPTQLKYLIILLIIFTALSTAYYQGRRAVQKEWDLSQAIIDKQIAELQAKQAELTTKVITEYVDRTKIVKQKGDTVIEYIDKYIPQENNRCVIPNNVVSLLDTAMQNGVPDSTASADANPSGISLTQVTSNTAGNYTTCNEYKEQVIALQSWINQQRGLTNATK